MSGREEARLAVEEKEGVTILRLSGDLDHAAYLELKAPIREKITESAGKVLIDLDKLNRITTPGWSVLLTARKQAKSCGATLRLLNLPVHLSAPFVTLGLETVFEVLDNEVIALRTFEETVSWDA